MNTLLKDEKRSIEETLLIIDTAIGLIALNYKDAIEAQNRGRSIIDTAPLTEPHVRNDELLDAHSIANRFNMDAAWFLCQARQGRIPHIRMGKYVRFDPTEIRQFFHRNTDRHANS